MQELATKTKQNYNGFGTLTTNCVFDFFLGFFDENKKEYLHRNRFSLSS